MKRLALSLFFIAAAASTQAQEVELVFEVNDPEARTATLSDGKSLRNATELIIPETTTIDGVEYTVTCIDFEGAPFGSKNTSKITHVLVPKTVTEIKHLSRIGSQRTPLQFEFAEGSALRIIGPDALQGNCMESMSIPATVDSIGENAFMNCHILRHISIPAGVKTLHDETFYYCDSLSAVELPEGLESIGDNAFSHCPSLRRIDIPASVKRIGDRAFPYDRGVLGCVEAVYMHGDVPPAIGKESFPNSCYIFVNNPDLIEIYKAAEGWGGYKVVAPATTGDAGLDAECTYVAVSPSSAWLVWMDDSIRSVDVAATVTSGGKVCTVDSIAIKFSSYGALTDVTINAPLRVIHEDMFQYCKNLVSVTLPQTVDSIGNNAFKDTKISELTIPAGARLAQDALSGMNYVEAFHAEGEGRLYDIDGVLYDRAWPDADGKAAVALRAYPMGRARASYAAAEGTETIARGAFLGAAIDALTLPASLRQIAYGAFEECAVGSIGFAPGSQLKVIESNAFSSVEELASFCLPAGAVIYTPNFSVCKSLAAITVEEGHQQYASEGGVLYSKDMKTLVLYPDGRPEPSYVLPASVEAVDPYAISWPIPTLKSFYALAPTPPSYHPADRGWMSYATLYVRQSALESYKAMSPWMYFMEIVGISDEEADAIITDIDGVKADGDGGAGPANGRDGWRTLGGVSVDKPSKGIYIHNGKKVVVN